MTIKEAAKKWECTENYVKGRIKEGIIPSAEKIKDGKIPKWFIPDGWPKPPMTRYQLCILIKNVLIIKNEGINYMGVTWGYSEKQLIDGFTYLSGCLFIKKFDEYDIENSIKEIEITAEGKKLLELDEKDRNDKKEKRKNKAKLNASAKVKASIGINQINKLEAEACLDNFENKK